MLRVRLVGFQHALEDIESGMLERPQALDRFLLHVQRRATVTTANSASWNRRILTSFSGLAGVGGPGVIDSVSNFVEHPEVVADRILRYANLVGRENVIAGADCGFGTSPAMNWVYPPIAWAKLKSLADGAALASSRLWP